MLRMSSRLTASLAALATASLAHGQVTQVDTGVEACPAYDELQQGILDYLSGNDPVDETHAEAPIAVEFILDASGSMEGQLAGATKMETARTALIDAVEALEPTQTWLGLRAYGFDTSVAKTPEASCPNTELLTDFSIGDAGTIRDAANGLTAYGYTPIAASLEAAAADLTGVEARERLIVLISDGEETCEGDPVATARQIREMGINLSTFIVGFDLDDAQAAQMRAVAEAGGGRYLDAPDGETLAETLGEITEVAVNKSERTMPRCLNPVPGGATPEEAVLLEPGIYTAGELLEPGTYRYYRVATNEGELGVVRGLIQSWRYHDDGDGPAEGTIALGAMTVRVLNADGSNAAFRQARERDRPGTGMTAYHLDTDGDGFLIALGDNYERLAPESLIEIAVEPAHDGEAGDSDADRNSPDIRTVSAGTPAAGHFGYDDETDLWRLDASGPTHVEIALDNTEMRYATAVYDEASGRRLARGDAVLEFDATGPVLIELRSREPSLAPKFSAYTITAEAAD